MPYDFLHHTLTSKVMCTGTWPTVLKSSFLLKSFFNFFFFFYIEYQGLFVKCPKTDSCPCLKCKLTVLLMDTWISSRSSTNSNLYTTYETFPSDNNHAVHPHSKLCTAYSTMGSTGGSLRFPKRISVTCSSTWTSGHLYTTDTIPSSSCLMCNI